MAHLSHRWTYREGTLLDEPSRTTSSSSSSYSLKEIIPEREPIPVIDLSDDESVEGPEMAPVVAPGIGPGTSIEEDPSEPTSDSEMQRAEAASQQVIALREEISRMDALFYAARQARRQETARAAMLEEELAQTRAAHAAREREILELINERDWLRQFIAQFLGTTRDLVDRARDELESRPGGSGSQSPNRTDEVMSENSQNRQSEPTRDATPRPEQATHKVIENFMIKMTELLETSMATRRNERVPVTGADEALERFLKFRPPEFYGDLNDIYDTLKYEDALRVTFAAFRFRGMAKDWWLRASEARTLKNQLWTWNDFQEEFKKEYIPRWLQRALAPLPPMGFAATVEAATRTEMTDQAVIQRKTAIGSATAPYKRPGQGPWKPRDFKRSRGEQKTGNEGRPTLTPGGSHRICTYCERSGHVAEMCYRKLRLCFKCGKPGHTKDQCPEM
ncbi:hypothetical protein M9H77_27958 [Catharanthus roseus]|uniref:Uncharacterized protein n=1 Tax=Catharanthus roseus TaxID=4058 RepID=A0ACC0AFV0_CATRO|nr:hypothetical protein M9H77_27958 [Catharanthus roseus]